MSNKDFWQNRWENNQTGWDLGCAAPPIAAYIDKLPDKNIKILIPGAGNAYEAEYLYKHGFKNVFVLDITLKPLKNLALRVPEFPKGNLLNKNFFEHTGKYDLIIEQTFFIAIDPEMRNSYINKMHELLIPGGVLAGLLIFDSEPAAEGPPFIDTFEGFRKYFYNDKFEVKKFEIAENSITPRAGREIFMELVNH
ncbi:MAG: SAM-dependent methyltransferase [Ignavibacteria bacterium]|nr:SAM-dependent methyltransferase [Ignavibacteria bacterium]